MDSTNQNTTPPPAQTPPATPSAPAAQPAAPQTPPAAPASQAPAAPAPTQAASTPPEHKKPMKLILIICILLMLALVGSILYIKFMAPSKTAMVTEPTPAPTEEIIPTAIPVTPTPSLTGDVVQDTLGIQIDDSTSDFDKINQDLSSL